MTDVPKARPASTVVLLRDTDNGMETLMLKRNKALMFLWVFPGGALEESDIVSARALRRHARLRKNAACVQILKTWCTSATIVEPKRFETWIYRRRCTLPLTEATTFVVLR